MFTHQLTEHMRRLIEEFKRNRQQKLAASARGRAINCMELEDRILLSATPIAPEALVNKNAADLQQVATQSTQSVAADANGNHVVVWSTQNQAGTGMDVHAQRFNANGVAVGNELKVNTNSGNEKEAKVAMNDNGSFVITWTDGDKNDANNPSDVYARRYDANGNALDAQEFLVNTTTDHNQQFSSVAMGNNSFYITWTSQNENGWNLFLQQYDTSGVKVGGEVQINSHINSAPIVSQVQIDVDGWPMVAWQDKADNGDNSIHAAYLYPDGSPWASEFTVNSTTGSNQQNPSLALNPYRYNSVITWTSYNADGTSDIYAQRFDDGVNPVGDAIHVNATAGNMANASVILDHNTNNFIVTWSSYSQDALGGWGVFSRAYNSDGTASTGEVRVNNFTDGSQNYSSAAFLNASSYVITWSGEGVGDTAGIYSEVCNMGLWGQYSNDIYLGNPTLAGQDIGSPTRPGSVNFGGKMWTMTGSGTGIGSASDQFYFASQDFAENGEFSARIASVSDTSGTVGAMFRNSSDADSAYAGVFLHGTTLSFQCRDAAGVNSPGATVSGIDSAVWVKVVRNGDIFSGFYSYNNIDWIQIGSAQNVSMSSIVQVGLAAASGDNTTYCTASFSQVTMLDPRNFVLAGRDIGSPGQNGSTTFTNGDYILSGGGSGIGGTADKYQFGASGLVGDWDLSAQITSADAGATAGVMFRNNEAAGSMFAAVLLGPDNILRFEYRGSDNGTVASEDGPIVSGPVWVKVTRSGDEFQGWYKTTGDWTQIGTAHTIAMNDSVLGGLAVTSNNDGTVCNATFSDAAISRAIAFNSTGADIGTPGHSGSTSYTNGGRYVITGSGNDLYAATDQFHFDSVATSSAYGSIVARVDSLTNTNEWAMGGAMYRENGNSNSPYVIVAATSEHGVTLQWRDESGNYDRRTLSYATGDTFQDPAWVKLTRNGNVFTASYSSDGVNWTDFADKLTIQMSDSALAGLAVASANGGALCTAEFTNVAVTQTMNFNFTDSDIGNPGLAGSSSSEYGYTITGSGNDLYASDDKFNFASNSCTGNETIIARIDSIGNTDGWAMGGVMFRENNNSNSQYVIVAATPGNGVCLQWRDQNGNIDYRTLPYDSGSSFRDQVWVKLTRNGDVFTASCSSDGVNWTDFADTPTVLMSNTIQAGLAVAAAHDGALCSVDFSHVSLPNSMGGPLVDSDIGGPGAAGSCQENRIYSVLGSGNDISSTSDSFNFASENHTGDGEIVARIDSLTNTCDWALSGVMFRDNDSPGSNYAIVAASPKTCIQFQWRSATDTGVGAYFQDYNYSDYVGADYQGPVWVKLKRVGNEFSAFFSMDGASWTKIGDTQSIAMGQTVKAGLAVAAGNQEAINTSTFSHVSISQASNITWNGTDVGGPTGAGAGSTTYADAAYVVAGGGGDIAGNYDQFHYDSQQVSGDLTMIARVDSLTDSNGWSKNGVMFRDGLGPNAMYAFVFLTPENGVSFEYRMANSDWYQGSPCSSGQAPVWLKLTRTGNVFTAYTSADGAAWNAVGSATIAMGENIQAGLAVTAHDIDRLNTADFSHVSLVETRNAGEAGSTLVAAQQGAATVNFDWGWYGTSPVNNSGIGRTDWSSTWQGKILAASAGTYTFTATADDGVRLWINDQLVVDYWYHQGGIPRTGTIQLDADQWYSIRLDYFQGEGGQACKLEWAPPGQAVTTVVPASNLSYDDMAPVNQMPAAQIAVENMPLTFGTLLGNAIQVSDADACYGSLQVTLAVNTGTLTLKRTDGLIFAAGDGSGDSSMTFIGSLADINAALDGMQFTPGTGYTGQVNLQMTTNDLAPAFTGGSRTDSDTVSITVASAQGFLATYFNNPDFTGTTVQRVDPTIDFNLSGASPVAGIDATDWSVRWIGWIQAPTTGNYTFHATTDGGCKVSINNVAVIDRLGQAGEFDSNAIAMTAGQSYLVCLEYSQTGAGGQAKLEWSGKDVNDNVILPQQVISSNQVSHVAQAPVNHLPAPQFAQLNTPVVFSAGNTNTITISNPSMDGNQASVTVLDGSFESPQIGSGDSYNPTGSAWTFEGYSGLTSQNGMVSESGAVPPSGAQAAFVQINGSAWQNVTFAETGNYTITFQAAYRQYGGASPVTVLIDGVNVGTITPDSLDFHGYQTDSIRVTAGTHRVTFSHQSNTDQVVFIDRVSIVKTEALVQVNLAVDPGAGTLTLARTLGLTFANGDGKNDASMTIIGSVDDINAAMDGLQYMPSLNYTGTANVHVTSSSLMSPFIGTSTSADDTVSVTVSAPVGQFSGLLCGYYNGGIWWTGTPAYRIDSTVDFDWGNEGSPAPGVPGTDWSAIWRGEVKADVTGTYTFHMTADDGVKVFVDNQCIIDQWHDQDPNSPPAAYTGTINLTAGYWYAIRVEYYQHDVGGMAKLEWSYSGQFQQVIPADHLSCASELQHVDTAPVNNLPSGVQIANQNAPLVFSTAHNNAISIADAESHYYDPLEVTLELASGTGTLSLAHTDWLTFSEGDGSGDTKMTFVGWAGDINSALEGLQYMPGAGYTGSAQIKITTNDLATVLIGGPKTTIGTVDINVSAPTDYSGLLGYFYDNTVGTAVNTENLALHKTVTQSSNYSGDSPQNLVDGNIYSFSHTASDAHEWVQVDLSPGTNTQLTQIKLVNRDSAGDRLQNFTVSVIASDGTVVWSQSYNASTNDGEVITFETGKIAGEYVRVQKNDANYLHLAEVQVFNLSIQNPDIVRVDPTIDFNWGNESMPAPGIPGSNWSATWLGKIQANYSEDYTFYLTGDDTVRLWINDQPVCGGYCGSFSGPVHLEAGQWYSIRLDFVQNAGYENVKLEWSSESQAREVIPSSQLSHEDTAPANIAPSQQTTDLNTPIVFSQANGNAIQVSDVDAIYGPIQVSLTVDLGNLTLHSPSSDLIVSGDGTKHVTLYGSLADINAALDGLSYTPSLSDTGTYIPAANLTIYTNDMAPVQTGGPKDCTSTVSISIAAPGVFKGLLATYYDNTDFTGTSVQRVDRNINFDWGSGGSPAQGVLTDGNNWSARWVGEIKADHTETYTFYSSSDDGVRLWVNGNLLIDRWVAGGNQQYSASIDLQAGQWYSIRMEYMQLTAEDYVKLEWSSASQSREAVCSDHFRIADQTPVNIVPGIQNGVADQPIVFSKAFGNEIEVNELQVSNPNGNSTILTVSLGVSQGTLTLGGVNGLTFTHYDGSDAGVNDQSMTFSGTIADINAALSGLTYARSGDAAATLTIATTDYAAPDGGRTATNTVQIGAVQQMRSGLLATFYSGTNMNTPITARIDSNINFDWGEQGSPAAGVPGTNWSAVWEGILEAPQSGNYLIYATTDDGCRLWINDTLLIDAFGPQHTSHTATINLEAGQKYSIRMEYNQFGGGENAILEWANVNAGIAREVIPESQFSHAIQAPAHFLPASPSVVEDTSLTFSSGTNNAITVVDVDAQSNILEVTLTATHGSINLQGTNAASVTISGSLADINAALDGLIFTPTAGYTGGAVLRIVTTDQTTHLIADNSMAIPVLAANHAPVNHLPTATLSVTEHQTLILTGANNTISVSDPDISGPSSVPVFNGSFDAVSVGTGYNADQAAPTGTGWTFNAFSTTTNADGSTTYNASGIAAERSGMRGGDSDPLGASQVAYMQGSGSISQNITFGEAGNYTISFQAAYRQYGGQHSFMVLIDGVSVGTFDPSSPTFQGYRTNSFAITTAGPHKLTFRGLSTAGDHTAFIDAISIDKAGSLVQVTLAADHGSLTLGNLFGLKFTEGNGLGNSTMTFSGSQDNVNAALDGLKFAPMNNFEGTAHLRITSNDLGNVGYGGQKTAESILAINVTAVNDAPVNAVPGSQGTYVNHPIVFTSSSHNAIRISDSDLDINALYVTVGDDSFENSAINSSNPPGSPWIFEGNSCATDRTGVLSDSGVVPPDGIHAALMQFDASISQNISFTESGSYAISFQAAYRQYGGPSPVSVLIDGVVVGTFTPDSVQFNGYQTDPIAITAGTHRVTFSHQSVIDQVVFIDQVSIVKTGSPNQMQTAPVVIGNRNFESSNIGLRSIQDQTAASWHLTQFYNAADGTPSRGGIVSNGSDYGNPLALEGTQAAVIQGKGTIWQDVNFTETGRYTLGFLAAARNGYNGANPVMVQIDGVSVGVITPTSTSYQDYFTNSFAVTAGTHRVTFVGMASGGVDQTTFIDQVSIAPTSACFQVQVHLAVQNGTLALGGIDGLTSSVGNGTSEIVLEGTIPDINAALEGLRYLPNGGFVGTDTLQITTNDLGNSGGSANSVTSTVSINIAGGPVVNSTTTDGITQQTFPESPQAVAADADGNYVVVWSSQNQDGLGWSVYGRRFNAAGNAQGVEFLVNSHATGNQQYATVAMNANGNFIVTWSSENQDGGGWGVYGQRFDAGCNAIGPEFRINGTTTSDQMYSSVAMNANGDFAVTWSSLNVLTNNWDVYARTYRADGAAGDEIQVNTQIAGDQMLSRIALDASGAFTVVWQSRAPGGNWDVYARQFDAHGNALSNQEIRVNDTTAGDQQNANIAMNASGGFVVSWTSDGQDGGGNGIFARQFNADGTTDRIYTVSGGGSDIWSNSDQFHFASEEVTGDATMIACVNSVSDTGDFAKAGVMFRNGSNANAAHAMIYVNPDNLVVFQWRSGDGASTTDTQWTNQSAGIVNAPVWVKLTRVGNSFSGYYSTDGVTWVQVGSTQSIAMSQSGPIQAGLAVTAWNANALCTATFKHVSINQSTDLNLSGLDIGSPVCAGSSSYGNEFQVNATVSGNQDYSSAAYDRRGNFFITWSSEDAPGKWSVYGRRYEADGTANGLEKRINATTDGSQLCSSVTSLSPENYMVVWSGNAPGDTAGVFYAEQGPLGLIATYYNNKSLSGNSVRRIDPTINFTWNADWNTSNSPAAGIGANYWSARWEGLVQAKDSGAYTFYATADDGVRLWVNGQLLVDGWIPEGTTTYSGTINLLAGQFYSIRMEYFQENGPDTAKLEWSATDNLGAVILPREIIPSTQFTYENPAPVNSLPGAPSINENTSIVFSTADGNALQISDFDVGTDSMEVSLSVDHGALKLARTDGLLFMAGSSGNGTAMTFRGTMADINAALDGLQFTSSGNYSGPVSLRIITNDLGSTGIGGAKVTTNTLALNVIAPPTIGIPGRQGVLEHEELAFSHAKGNAILIGDPAVGDKTVEVTLSVDNGTIFLGGIKGLNFAAGSIPTGHSMTFTGSIADVNAALEGMRFVSRDLIYDETASLHISVNDLGNAGTVNGPQAAFRSVDIGVTAVNDAPKITLPENLGTDPARIVFSNANGNPIRIGDPDSLDGYAIMTILVKDGVFNLGGTAGLGIQGGTPAQSSFIQVYGTLSSLNRALDGLVFKTNSTYAELQITVDDLGAGVGVLASPRQTTQTVYARRTIDPNFTPSDGGSRIQQRAGIITLPGSSAAQELLRGGQMQSGKLALDREQNNTKLFTTDLQQNTNARFVDGRVANRGSDQRIDRGGQKLSADFADVRDAKLMEEVLFSADTQNVAEPVQTGSTLRRDENILVGLGVVSAGYLAWAFNGGSLLAGAISATPMWKPFDPLAVLDFSDRSKSGLLPLDGEAGIVGDDNLQSLLS